MSRQIEHPTGAPEGTPTPKKNPRHNGEPIPPLKGIHRAVPIVLFAMADRKSVV